MAEKKANNDPAALVLTRLVFKVLTPVFPGLMNRLAYKLWITPPRFTPPEREQVFLQRAKAGFVLVNDLKIRTWAWGEGPTILFAHGWGGRGTQACGFIDELNQAGFQVVSLDMPAHGQSDGKRTNAIEMGYAVDEVIKQIDHLHAVITHSFGGMIFAHYYNDNVALKKIVMICPPSTLNTAFNQFSETLQLSDSVKAYIIKTLKKNFGDDVVEQFSLIKNGARITQPVLIVHDEQDDVVPYQDGKDIANILQHGSFYGTKELGHRKVLYEKSVINAILEFVKS
ncbi:alpha/beta fold hydrolase [Candidatus Berkiella aquae]|uniref:Alpha/beta hydrolase n=1 Tax=Candidatus Berkiella aquae TaxID=295108 RepID=A0A0Q9YXY9_9GAMM|nr:alpha/beta hydrolase [Candidatus Berkiella aquae]MCS5711536.1 alpha/beta hydrolase [Candidatus Berkiella aquae]